MRKINVSGQDVSNRNVHSDFYPSNFNFARMATVTTARSHFQYDASTQLGIRTFAVACCGVWCHDIDLFPMVNVGSSCCVNDVWKARKMNQSIKTSFYRWMCVCVSVFSGGIGKQPQILSTKIMNGKSECGFYWDRGGNIHFSKFIVPNIYIKWTARTRAK